MGQLQLGGQHVVSKRKRSRRSADLRSNYGQRMFGDVLSMASTVAESRKHKVSQRLSQLASTTKDLSNEIDDIPYVGEFAEAAAHGIEKLAAYVDNNDVPHMLDDISSFARRQPGAMVALGVVAGLIATQLLGNRPFYSEGRSSRRGEGKRGR
jgi:uncharacterized membrane protein YdfJ with MMPL/SSD domain